MKIGIAGDKTLAKAWESRIQSHIAVTEVEFADSANYLSADVTAVLLIQPVEINYDEAAKTVRDGKHLFLISRLPTQRDQIERLYHYSEESGVHLQLAHWSSYSPATQWINQHIQQPELIHIHRQLTFSQFKAYDNPVSNLWLDDLAYCLKLVRSNVHRVDVGIAGIGKTIAPHLQIYIRFDNGTTAVLYLNATSTKPVHKRFLTDDKLSAEHNILEQSVTLGKLSTSNDVYFEKRSFLDEEPADRALSLFLRSVQSREAPLYSIYDSLKLVKVIDQIEERVYRPY